MVKKVVKALAAVLIFVIIFEIVQFPLIKVDPRPYQTWKAFYGEEKNALDAVYIGASNTYAYFQAPLAYKDYGITVYPLSFPGLPAASIKYLIEESRKTQPDALYIISVNDFRELRFTTSWIHLITDNMKFSKTKINLINALCDELKISRSDRLEFFIPMFKLHANWSTVSSKSFDVVLEGIKGASNYAVFFSTTDVSNDYNETDRLAELTEDQDRILKDLLDYIKTNNIKVMFLMVPQSGQEEIPLAQLNTIEKIVNEEGFECLNMLQSIDDIGLSLKTDFYNSTHTNIHGSIKYTDYFSKYLVEKYGLKDKRNTAGYESWDEAVEKYINIIDSRILDIELTHQSFDQSLSAPHLSSAADAGNGINLSWTKVENAEGYSIYRKVTNENPNTYNSKWENISEVNGNTYSYLDESVKPNVNYTYTVVPFYNKDGKKVYGDFSQKGIRGQTLKIDTPVLESLTENDGSIKITWKTVDSATGYNIYRKIVGQNYKMIATVKKVNEYIDKNYLNDIPYLYTVRAIKEEKGKTNLGSYDANGLLRLVNLPAPDVKISKDADGAVNLEWNKIKGASRYYVYRQTDGENWELIADNIALGKESFTDKALNDGKKVSYKAAAVIIHGDDVYEYPSDAISLE